MAGRRKGGGNGGATVVIRREEVVEGGHHGGAWKVAYADFVTAMMAFFLLMWLINATTEAQRKGLADYFSPTNYLGRTVSGSGKPFGGRSPYESGDQLSDSGVQAVQPGRAPSSPDEGAADSDLSAQTIPTSPPEPVDRTDQPQTAHGNAAQPVTQEGDFAPGGGVAPRPAASAGRVEFLAEAGAGAVATPDPTRIPDAALQAEWARRERAAFEQAAEQIRRAVADDPALADLARQLRVEITPQGLRLQVLDAERRAMFDNGSASLQGWAEALLRKVAPVLARLPEPIAISGHTDAAPYRGAARTNWDLSSDRANATRRALTAAGLDAARFAQVSGAADREPLVPDDPLAPANRRIAILVLRTAAAPAPP